ncbi:hypothetical protein MTO96_028147 [Rhipicephalus appendiculatus]
MLKARIRPLHERCTFAAGRRALTTDRRGGDAVTLVRSPNDDRRRPLEEMQRVDNATSAAADFAVATSPVECAELAAVEDA